MTSALANSAPCHVIGTGQPFNRRNQTFVNYYCESSRRAIGHDAPLRYSPSHSVISSLQRSRARVVSTASSAIALASVSRAPIFMTSSNTALLQSSMTKQHNRKSISGGHETACGPISRSTRDALMRSRIRPDVFAEITPSLSVMFHTLPDAQLGISPPRGTSSQTDAVTRRSSVRSCRRIRINVCGLVFETDSAVLDRHPTTLLGNWRRRLRFYDSSRNELFIDRHRPSFEAVFTYYQTGGRLRRPQNVPDDVFIEELAFYELESGKQ